MNEYFSEIIFQCKLHDVRDNVHKSIWNCARLGLVNKTGIFQVGEGRAGCLRLKDSQTTSLNSQKRLEAMSI